VLCNPKNLHVGIWRNIRVESARDISEGTLKIRHRAKAGIMTPDLKP